MQPITCNEGINTMESDRAQPLTATVNYKSERKSLLQGQRVNIALYEPNTPCDALPGSPVFPTLWCLAFWWPGYREEYRLFNSEDIATIAVTELYNG